MAGQAVPRLAAVGRFPDAVVGAAGRRTSRACAGTARCRRTRRPGSLGSADELPRCCCAGRRRASWPRCGRRRWCGRRRARASPRRRRRARRPAPCRYCAGRSTTEAMNFVGARPQVGPGLAGVARPVDPRRPSSRRCAGWSRRCRPRRRRGACGSIASAPIEATFSVLEDRAPGLAPPLAVFQTPPPAEPR